MPLGGMLGVLKAVCRRVVPAALWERVWLLRWRALAKIAHLSRRRRLGDVQVVLDEGLAPRKVFLIVID
ncbi:MAG: hypothetical protein ACYS1C_11990, partial [Planctomycetota bacterium]